MQNELGMKTLGALICLTPGEVRLRDLQRQTRLDEGDVDRSIEVMALSANGLPTDLELRFTRKWSTRGFEIQLACPICREPSRVLRQRGEVYCCARCAPRSTAHHLFKNCKRWRDGGKTTEGVVHELTGGDADRPSARLQKLAVDLARGTMARAEALLPDIYARLDAADAIIRHREQVAPE